MKKDNGSVIHMFSIVLSAVFIGLLLLIYAGISSNINRRNEVDLVARKYLLMMEIEGGLTTEMKDDLIEDLNKFGIKNLSFTGTTMVDSSSPSNYGTIITLKFKGNMPLITYDNKKNKVFKMMQITLPSEISNTSVSKN